MNEIELFKILLSDKPSDRIKNNEKEIFEFIPELKDCKGFNQNNDWHVYDVYEHILHVVDYVDEDLILRLTALFHDIGKPLSYTEDSNHIGHFRGHWDQSMKIFLSYASKLNLDEDTKKLVSNLIYYHDISLDKMCTERFDELCNVFTISELKLLFKLKKADILAQNSKYYYLLDKCDKEECKMLKRLKS